MTLAWTARPVRLTPDHVAEAVILPLSSLEPGRLQAEAIRVQRVAIPETLSRAAPARQTAFLAGRLAAWQAQIRGGYQPQPVPVGPDREPVWPDGLVGSISHTGHHAAALVVDARVLGGAGLDLERWIEPARRTDIAEMVLDRGECEALDRLVGAWSPEALLTLVFSAKETFYKAAYGAVGRFFDFGALRFIALDAEQGCLHLEVAQDLAPGFACGQPCQCWYDRLDADTVITSWGWPR